MIVSVVLGKHVVEAFVIFNDWGFPFLALMAIPCWSPHNTCDQESSGWAQPPEACSCSCRYKWQWLWDSDDTDMQSQVPLLKFSGSPVLKRGRVKISAVFSQDLRFSISYPALKGMAVHLVCSCFLYHFEAHSVWGKGNNTKHRVTNQWLTGQTQTSPCGFSSEEALTAENTHHAFPFPTGSFQGDEWEDG